MNVYKKLVVGSFTATVILLSGCASDEDANGDNQNVVNAETNESEANNEIDVPSKIKYKAAFRKLPNDFRDKISDNTHIMGQYNNTEFKKRLEIAAEYTNELTEIELHQLLSPLTDTKTGEVLYSSNREQVKSVLNSKETIKKEGNNKKEWKDLTSKNLKDNMIKDFPANVEDYISNVNKSFQKEPESDSKMIQAGYSKYHYYYLKSQSANTVLNNVVEVKGGSLKKDLENLKKLTEITKTEQLKRGEHLKAGQFGKNKREAVKHWKKPSERMKQSIEYTKQLLNDIDAAINKDGKGDTFGVSYQAGGNKTNKLEAFIDNGK